jgi:hypothetical protein
LREPGLFQCDPIQRGSMSVIEIFHQNARVISRLRKATR